MKKRDILRILKQKNMKRLLDEPIRLGNSYIYAGYACPQDGTPHYYRVSTDERVISCEEKDYAR